MARASKVVGVVVVLLLATASVYAQTGTTGVVLGTVSDGTGAVIASAKVTLTDTSSSFVRNAETNSSGQYLFPSVPSGNYQISVEAPGFKQAQLTAQVEVAKSARADVVLQVGSGTAVVEVSATAAALQTTDSSVGEVVTQETMVRLPTIQRRVAELIYLQVGAQPITGSGGYDRGGGVAGAAPDQNLFTVDGLDVNDPEEGGVFGQIGPGMPLPLEAIEEFRGTVTNPNATFGRVSGGQFAFSTRHGGNDLHGSSYWYYRNDNLDANTWTRNFLGEPRPELKDNRFGGRLGGPIVKDKTFFFGLYEGRRFPQSADALRIVPTDSFRNGILRFEDAAGNTVNYDLATSTLCGPANNQPCDPRGIGISPVISSLMSLYPDGNSPSDGDGSNLLGFRAPANTSQRDDFAMARLDHNLNQMWRLNGSFIYSRERNHSASQLEFDPTLTGGGFTSLSGLPNEGRVANISATGVLRPNLVNELRVGWTQTGVPLQRQLARIQVAAAGAPLDLAFGLMDSPGDPNGGRARPQFGREHVWQFIDNLNWTKGNHNLQFGVNFQHLHFHHERSDKGRITIVPTAAIDARDFVSIPANQRPPTCVTDSQTNCLQPGDESRWNRLYAANLGIIDRVTDFTTRDAEGRPNATGTPNIADVNWKHLELYAADTFRVNSSWTLNYGLNFMFETPVNDTKGRQSFLIDVDSGEPINALSYLSQKAGAARQGETFNPTIGFVPKSTLNRGIYPNQAKFSPRVAIAWNPSFDKGFLGTLFGSRKTVLRGGYGLVFSRINAVGPTEVPLFGELTGDTHIIGGPVNGSGDPYRVGVDGPVPIPVVDPPVLPNPFLPTARVEDQGYDPDFSVGKVHSANFSMQRELPGNMIGELGWIGRYGRNLTMSVNLNAVPVFMKDMSGISSQTFGQAFDATATELRSGVPAAGVTPQPWFENNLGAASTVGLATADSSSFIDGALTPLFLNLIDPALIGLGKSPILSQQFQNYFIVTNPGWANYDAFYASLRKRTSHGLSLTVNYTWSHARDTANGVQDNLGNVLTDSFRPSYDYGDALTDRRHSFTAYWTYDLPFARTHRWLGGWQVSGIFSAYSGLPILVGQSGSVFGDAFGLESAPVVPGAHFSTGLHRGVTGSNGVGTSGDPADGGTGLSLFADPEAAFNNFRHILVSQDRRTSRGVIRSLPWWNVDASVGKEFKVSERVRLGLSFDFFNLFNRVIFQDPSLNITSPSDFGVISGQAGAVSSGDFAGPRRIQVGFRVDF